MLSSNMTIVDSALDYCNRGLWVMGHSVLRPVARTWRLYRETEGAVSLPWQGTSSPTMAERAVNSRANHTRHRQGSDSQHRLPMGARERRYRCGNRHQGR